MCPGYHCYSDLQEEGRGGGGGRGRRISLFRLPPPPLPNRTAEAEFHKIKWQFLDEQKKRKKMFSLQLQEAAALNIIRTYFSATFFKKTGSEALHETVLSFPSLSLESSPLVRPSSSQRGSRAKEEEEEGGKRKKERGGWGKSLGSVVLREEGENISPFGGGVKAGLP